MVRSGETPVLPLAVALAFLAVILSEAKNLLLARGAFVFLAQDIRPIFAYAVCMEIGGYSRDVDLERLGPSVALAAAQIFAIRNARRPAEYDASLSNREIEAEVDFAVHLAGMIVVQAARKHPALFRKKDTPWYKPSDDDVQL